jgi:hypothetical protein
MLLLPVVAAALLCRGALSLGRTALQQRRAARRQP